jgi:O-antigen/teichoic acid export membrane protein
MSRFRRVIHSVASGYLLLGVTALYGLATLPLGLRYLSTDRMGLWTLMAGIAGYLSLIDFGMSGSLARLLVDYKDNRDGGQYGGLIKTGWLVLLTQGTIIGIVGYFLAPALAPFEKLSPELRPEFISLMRWQTTALAINFYLRIFAHVLGAHQRNDLVNYFQMANLCLAFVLLWFFFHAGHGVLSLAWATLVSASSTSILSAISCLRLRLLPARGKWGHASWALFREMFDYGKDMVLVAVGAMLIMMSQSFIVTRELGPAASTLWYAGTRMFTLVSQAIWRISDMSMPAFSEMIVRGESNLLRERYKNVLILTASVSAFCAVSFAMCNSAFIVVWTGISKKTPLAWPSSNDMLLALWMILMGILHCHNTFVLVTKRIGFMRYIYFLEGMVFVCAAVVAAKYFGLAGMIVCSIVCSALFSGAYGIWRLSDYFKLPLREVGFKWLEPMCYVLLLFGPVAFLVWLATRGIESSAIRLAIHVLACALIGLPVLLRLGVPAGLRRELLQRAPGPFRFVLRPVFGIQ